MTHEPRHPEKHRGPAGLRDRPPHAPARPRSPQPHHTRHRLRDRHGDLRAHRRRRVAARGPRAGALDDHRGRRLRPGGPLLRRAGVDDPGGWKRVHLRVRLRGRVRRLDDRVGPDPGVRAEHVHHRGRMVGLLRELPAGSRTSPSAGAHRRAGHRHHGAGRRDGDGRVQSARGADRSAGQRPPHARHPAVGRHEHRTGADQGRGAGALRRVRRGVRAAGEPDSPHPAQHRRVRRPSAGAACSAARP